MKIGTSKEREGFFGAKYMEEFIHEYTGFYDRPSKGHIRIIDAPGKPLVIMCSQVAEAPDTSVTNMAEHIADYVNTYLERDNFTLISEINKYFHTKKTFRNAR